MMISQEIDKKLLYIVIAGNLVLFAIWSLIFFSWSVDDLLISARYAKNLVEHGIWNWNADNERVEAYTTLTYTLIPILGEIVNINPFLVLKLFGIFLYGLTIHRLYTYRESMRSFLWSLTFVNLYFFVFIHIYSGFETYFFAFILFEIILLLTGRMPFKETYFYLLLVLLPLTRPEGAAFSLLAFIVAFTAGQIIHKKRSFAIILTLASVYMVWRIWYFGHLLPNTFYVKSVSDSIFSNVKLLFSIYLNKIIYIAVLVGLIYIHKNRAVKILGSLSLCILLFLYYPSGLATDVGSRFFFQITFFILLIGFLIGDQLKSRLAFGMICFFLIANTFTSYVSIPFLAKLYPTFHMGHVDIGKRLLEYKDKDYTVAICEAGAIPYYSEWKSYDLLALADERLARETLTREYLEDTKPDLFLIISDQPEIGDLTLTLGHDPKRTKEKIFKDFLADHPEYVYVAASKRFFDTYTISILNQNIPDFEAIKKELEENEALSRNFEPRWKDILKQKYFFKDIRLPN